ncbi:MAG TPA: DMT family transporter [Acidimicrobiales bacterium]|nr:DMT family transporter [Acidimicrobiales bacterium]
MAIVLGLLVAATYGAADFFGGLSSKRASVPAVVVLSQLTGLPLLAVLVVVAGGDATSRTVGLGMASGLFGGFGLVCLYRGLSSGRMSVVAPVTAVGAAIVPVGWGLVQGERPGGAALVGVGLALLAVALISRTDDDVLDGEDSGSTPPPAAGSLLLAAVAGVGFGTVFVLLAETGDDAGFWPLVAGRLTSIPLLAVGTVLTGRSFAVGSRRAVATIVGAGVLDMAANALFLLASRQGLLALVGVLSSLYPASTVLLARLVLQERLRGVQVVGLTMAGAGVVLIAA